MNGLTRRAVEYRMLFPNVTPVWDLLDSLSHEPGVNLRMPSAQGSGAPVPPRKAIHRCPRCGVGLTANRGHQCLIQLDPHSTSRAAS
jgi:hypothetical protein